jgi:DNA replication protein DnaC
LDRLRAGAPSVPGRIRCIALHKRSSELFRDLSIAHADGSFGCLLLKLSRVDVLLVDDFAMAP